MMLCWYNRENCIGNYRILKINDSQFSTIKVDEHKLTTVFIYTFKLVKSKTTGKIKNHRNEKR